ncbi:cral trio domain-containing [Pyrenophora seminiperda CCB06]|uniref:Phosphatidylinositol transfer protein SFH5 n=1 Tax=Pyrenophora seminiperda CCB06 TaxID=1302712 RepID=A0A3M7MB72_9PLEO|nr:cral trio domain-containing [Pyrenophora seminiperda CCB06]
MRPEEVNTAPVEAANAPAGASVPVETQPKPQLTAETTERKDEPAAVEATTAAVADLSVAEKDQDKSVEDTAPANAPIADQKVEEDKTVEQAAPTVEQAAPTMEQAAPAVAATSAEAKPSEASSEPVWPETTPDHPLTKFYDAFEALVASAEHNEVYGIELSKSKPFHTKLILQKFLRANQNDVEKAKTQLLETLKWRKQFDPIKAVNETFDKAKFEGLGYVLEVEGVPESPNTKDVATFNIYGAVKDNKATFGDLDLFLRWRVGLMEKSVQALRLADASTPIPNYGEGPDPYQGFQVHDYLQVSFLRRDPLVKAATNKTIEILGAHYPETLSRKFFVNVPTVMGWVFQAVKLVVAKETRKKFVVLSNGGELAMELGKSVPKSYGGEREDLAVCAEGMRME